MDPFYNAFTFPFTSWVFWGICCVFSTVGPTENHLNVKMWISAISLADILNLIFGGSLYLFADLVAGNNIGYLQSAWIF